MKTNELFRIGNRDDALGLLDEMIAKIEEIDAQLPPAVQGIDKAIGSMGYYWPRLLALRDAFTRGIIG